MANDSTRQHLLGTWKLITAVREEISSGTKTEFLGEMRSRVRGCIGNQADDQRFAEVIWCDDSVAGFVSDWRPNTTRAGPETALAGKLTGIVGSGASASSSSPSPNRTCTVELIYLGRSPSDNGPANPQTPPASRSSGEWRDDDFDVLADGVVVGRIIKVTRGTGGRAVGVRW